MILEGNLFPASPLTPLPKWAGDGFGAKKKRGCIISSLQIKILCGILKAEIQPQGESTGC